MQGCLDFQWAGEQPGGRSKEGDVAYLLVHQLGFQLGNPCAGGCRLRLTRGQPLLEGALVSPADLQHGTPEWLYILLAVSEKRALI